SPSHGRGHKFEPCTTHQHATASLETTLLLTVTRARHVLRLTANSALKQKQSGIMDSWTNFGHQRFEPSSDHV
ncbi:MAG TPA: hypothetical protein DCE31_03080, partial [Lautropia sp.]|nr:hypothetical protein [Lautropia sp.]